MVTTCVRLSLGADELALKPELTAAIGTMPIGAPVFLLNCSIFDSSTGETLDPSSRNRSRLSAPIALIRLSLVTVASPGLRKYTCSKEVLGEFLLNCIVWLRVL